MFTYTKLPYIHIYVFIIIKSYKNNEYIWFSFRPIFQINKRLVYTYMYTIYDMYIPIQ